MNPLFKKYLLSSVAFAPPDDPPGEADETPEDERIEVDETDDETPHDPEGETEDEAEGADDGDEQDGADDADPGAAGGERPATRGDRQVATLRAERRRLADENARITRELDDMRRGRQQPVVQQAVETPQQRADRFALMSGEDRIREEMREALDRNERNTQQLMGQMLDQSDQASFTASAASNPLARKLGPEVERRLADLRSRGQNLPRNVVLTYLIGEKVLAQRAKEKPGASQRRRQQDTRPARGGSDVGQSRQERRAPGSADDYEKRFGDVPI